MAPSTSAAGRRCGRHPLRTGSTSSAAVAAVGRHADVARAVAQQPRHQRHDGERGRGGAERRRPPAPRRVDPGHQRQEDQLPGRAAGGEDAGDQARGGRRTSGRSPSPRATAPSSRCRGRPARPSSRISCQLAVMKTVSPLPSATTSSAHMTTRRMPKRSISAAANGAVRPYSTRLTETAAEMVADRPAELVAQRVDQHAGRGAERRRRRRGPGTPPRRPTRRGGCGGCGSRDGHAGQHDGRGAPRASGPTANMCKNPAMMRSRHEVAVLALTAASPSTSACRTRFLGARRAPTAAGSTRCGSPASTAARCAPRPALRAARARRRDPRDRRHGDRPRHRTAPPR